MKPTQQNDWLNGQHFARVSKTMLYDKRLGLRCLDMGDHIPTRSLPFFRARLLLSTLLNPVTQLPAP